MMELNRKEIIKALEYCINDATCEQCPYSPSNCYINENALTLIKELAEENKILRGTLFSYIITPETMANIKAEIKKYGQGNDPTGKPGECGLKRDCVVDTVRKMQKLFEERLDISVCGYSTEEVKSDCFETLERIAEEILEGNK